MSRKKRHPDKAEDKPAEPGDQTLPAQAPADADAAGEPNELLGRLQRVSADYLNYQKRMQREMADAREFANAGLIKDLLGVLDDMERALAAAENHAEAPAGRTSSAEPNNLLLAGMRLVYDKAQEVLARYGLQRIEAEGKPFDPTRHEAMMQQPSESHEVPTVLRELQRGYELKGRVIRPARVVVSGPAPSQQEETEPDSAEGNDISEGE